jgi:hypothetical protein
MGGNPHGEVFVVSRLVGVGSPESPNINRGRGA